MNQAVFYITNENDFNYIKLFVHALEMAGYKTEIDTEESDSHDLRIIYMIYKVRWA